MPAVLERLQEQRARLVENALDELAASSPTDEEFDGVALEVLSLAETERAHWDAQLAALGRRGQPTPAGIGAVLRGGVERVVQLLERGLTLQPQDALGPGRAALEAATPGLRAWATKALSWCAFVEQPLPTDYEMIRQSRAAAARGEAGEDLRAVIARLQAGGPLVAG